jgi:hypothetical protein
MIVYTLQVHDEKYPAQPDQILGAFEKSETAVKLAEDHWVTLAGAGAMPLEFITYHSDNTGLNFHVAAAFRDFTFGKVTYSVNGFQLK